MYRYSMELLRVVDGDTVDCRIDLGFTITQEMRLRLKDVNCPEIRGESRPEGLRAKEFVQQELAEAKVLAVETFKIGNFGRYIANVYYSKRKMSIYNVFQKKYLLNAILVEQGLAQRTTD